jgi:hypothetical protein
MDIVPSAYEKGIRIGFIDHNYDKVTPIVSIEATMIARKIAASSGLLVRMLRSRGGRKM